MTAEGIETRSDGMRQQPGAKDESPVRSIRPDDSRTQPGEFDELVERLRKVDEKYCVQLPSYTEEICEDAATAIQTLQSRLAESEAERERLHSLAKANNDLARHTEAERKRLRSALADIAEATSAEEDAGENYRWDDREGALDYAYSTARAALNPENSHG